MVAADPEVEPADDRWLEYALSIPMKGMATGAFHIHVAKIVARVWIVVFPATC
jgi:hypothetical protein